MSQTPNSAIAAIGIDIGKNAFHVVGHDARGAIVLRQKWSRGQVEARLARRPHYHVHFTPTSASWINQVERWSAELTRKQIRRGAHTSVRQLEADIRTFIDQHNKNAKPFKWTKSADQILASVKRFCYKAQQTLCGEL